MQIRDGNKRLFKVTFLPTEIIFKKKIITTVLCYFNVKYEITENFKEALVRSVSHRFSIDGSLTSRLFGHQLTYNVQ